MASRWLEGSLWVAWSGFDVALMWLWVALLPMGWLWAGGFVRLFEVTAIQDWNPFPEHLVS